MLRMLTLIYLKFQTIAWISSSKLQFHSFCICLSRFVRKNISSSKYLCRATFMNCDFIAPISIYRRIFNAWHNCFIRLYVRYTSHHKSIIAGIRTYFMDWTSIYHNWHKIFVFEHYNIFRYRHTIIFTFYDK